MEILDIVLELEENYNMQYIAIAIPQEQKDIVSEIESNSISFDLRFIHQELETTDEEVRGGVYSFANRFNLLVLKTLKLSTSRENNTSSDINQNLINYHLREERSLLIDFLIKYKGTLPKKYFIIFAFEWHEGDPCRYKKIKNDELSDYFLKNNSWYLWLFDYLKDYESPNLDIPLILEIDNV